MAKSHHKKRLERERVDYATNQLLEAGIEPTYEDGSVIEFMFHGSKIKLFPFTGWFTGRTVKDGRGIHNLLKQVKK